MKVKIPAVSSGHRQALALWPLSRLAAWPLNYAEPTRFEEF